MPTDTSLEESRKNKKEWLSFYCVTGGVRSDGRLSKSPPPCLHMPHIDWGEAPIRRTQFFGDGLLWSRSLHLPMLLCTLPVTPSCVNRWPSMLGILQTSWLWVRQPMNPLKMKAIPSTHPATWPWRPPTSTTTSPSSAWEWWAHRSEWHQLANL